VLRIVATILKIIAWIVLVLGFLGGCATLVLGLAGASTSRGEFGPLAGLLGGALGGVVLIIFALLYFLFIYAYGELISLLIALEENTRLTAERLQSMTKPNS
jgi:hypothetical protein